MPTSRPWDMEDVKARGYRPGSILRVEMHNFITYDDAEVFPGPRLNIILGPNGTGKSTLTHAICLACAGVPSSVGRSDDLRHFIKRGKEHDKCYCEVDILMKNETVVTVRRILNSETKGSKWQINGRMGTQKEVKELMNNMHIDVDNLCTFMPQDRVSAFTQMNPKKLLQSTLECIKTGDGGNLHDEQKELAGIQSTKNDKQKEVEARHQEIFQMEQRLRGMQGEVDRVKNREKLEEKLTMYKVRLAVMDLEEKANAIEEKQHAIDEAAKELADIQSRIQPHETKVRELQKKQASHEKTMKSISEKKIKADDHVEVARAHVEELDVKVENCKRNVENHAIMKRNEEEKLRQINENLRLQDAKYQEALSRVPQLEKGLSEAKKDYEEVISQLNVLSERQNSLRYEIREPQAAEQEIRLELTKLKDHREVFCSKIQPRFPDVVQAMKWIDNNRERFVGECFGPVAVEIEVKAPEDAAMLETVIPINKMMAFLVENPKDEELMNRELRERLRLKINVTTMYERHMPPFHLSADYIQRAKAEFGFEGILGDKFDMPDTVRAYLNSFLGLHKIICARGPQASKQISLSVLKELSQPSCMLFAIDVGSNGGVVNITQFTAQMSRFASSRNDMPSTKSISVKPAQLLGPTSHSDTLAHKEDLQNRLNATTEKLKSLNTELMSICQEVDRLQVERDKKRSMMNELKRGISSPDSLKSALLREEKRRDALSRKLKADQGQERTLLIKELKHTVMELFSGMEAIHERCLTVQEAIISKEWMSVSSRGLLGDLFAAREAFEEAKRNLTEVEARIRDLEDERNAAKLEKTNAEKVISDLEESLGSEEKLNEFFVQASKDIKVTTKKELEEQKAKLEGQLEQTVDNPELVRQYETLLVDIQTARAEHDKRVVDLNRMQETISDRENAWLRNVKSLAAKLNTDFGRFMEELNFEGEVGLVETGGFMDFEVQMKVNFRSDGVSQLRQLSGLGHSGGERSVSTVMYLMALQELSAAPFRVVDEINQGMDERNERLVFDRIVRSCCSRGSHSHLMPNNDHSSGKNTSSVASPSPGKVAAGEGSLSKAQYFLVSPKLLPGLRAMDNDDVTVLMVYNGPGVNDLWQMGDIITALRKRKASLLSEA